MALKDNLAAFLKEDANMEELEGALSGYIKPSELSKEDFTGLIKGSKEFASLFDSEVNTRRDTGVNNFMEKKLPEILKEKEEAIRAELNPKESEAAKVAREFKEYKQSVENKERLANLKDELSNKAKELEFDPIKARDYAVYGDSAINKLESDVEWFKTELESRLSSEIKSKYSKEQPKSTPVNLDDIDSRILEARSKGDSNTALRLQMMKDAQ